MHYESKIRETLDYSKEVGYIDRHDMVAEIDEKNITTRIRAPTIARLVDEIAKLNPRNVTFKPPYQSNFGKSFLFTVAFGSELMSYRYDSYYGPGYKLSVEPLEPSDFMEENNELLKRLPKIRNNKTSEIFSVHYFEHGSKEMSIFNEKNLSTLSLPQDEYLQYFDKITNPEGFETIKEGECKGLKQKEMKINGREIAILTNFSKRHMKKFMGIRNKNDFKIIFDDEDHELGYNVGHIMLLDSSMCVGSSGEFYAVAPIELVDYKGIMDKFKDENRFHSKLELQSFNPKKLLSKEEKSYYYFLRDGYSEKEARELSPLPMKEKIKKIIEITTTEVSK